MNQLQPLLLALAICSMAAALVGCTSKELDFEYFPTLRLKQNKMGRLVDALVSQSDWDFIDRFEGLPDGDFEAPGLIQTDGGNFKGPWLIRMGRSCSIRLIKAYLGKLRKIRRELEEDPERVENEKDLAALSAYERQAERKLRRCMEELLGENQELGGIISDTDLEVLELVHPDSGCYGRLRKFYLELKRMQLELKEKEEEGEEKGVKDELVAKKLRVISHLEFLAEHKFRKCLVKPIKNIKEAMLGVRQDLERRFDLFVMAGFNRKKASQEELLVLASRFSFFDEKLHYGKLVEVAKKYAVSGKNRAEQLVDFINFLCADMLYPLRNILPVYNIARIVEPSKVEDVPIRFLKLNEYNRICLSWTKMETRGQTEIAIHEGVKKMKKKLFMG